MSTLYVACALVILLSVMLGLVRVVRGPTVADGIVAAQLFATAGVAIVLLLAEASAVHALRDVALVFALLAVIVTVAFVHRAWPAPPARGESGHGD